MSTEGFFERCGRGRTVSHVLFWCAFIATLTLPLAVIVGDATSSWSAIFLLAIAVFAVPPCRKANQELLRRRHLPDPDSNVIRFYGVLRPFGQSDSDFVDVLNSLGNNPHGDPWSYDAASNSYVYVLPDDHAGMVAEAETARKQINAAVLPFTPFFINSTRVPMGSPSPTVPAN